MPSKAAGGLSVSSLIHALSFLDYKSLVAASQVNVLWHGASSADELWMNLAVHHGYQAQERKTYRRFACLSAKVSVPLCYDYYGRLCCKFWLVASSYTK